MIHATKYPDWLRIYLLPVIIATASCYQLIFYDYAYGHDWIFELVRLQEYSTALESGQFLPYWADNLYRGFGSPIFVFYAPLYNLIASLLIILGMSLKNAAILSLIGLMITATIGIGGLMYEIGKQNDNSNTIVAARLTAIAYVLSPYLLSNLLVRNASAELTALCLAPLSFWGLALLRRYQTSGLILLTLGVALIILAHNLTALVVTAMLFICSISFFLIDKQRMYFTVSIISILTGIGISTWFWLPALFLKNEVRIYEMLTGKFNYHNNFTPISNLFNYDYLYSSGLFALAIVLIGFFILSTENYKKQLLLVFMMFCASLFLFLQLSISNIIWESIPLMNLFQFPWRMMGPYSFCVALILGVILLQKRKITLLHEIFIITVITANAIPYFKRYIPLPENISAAIETSITTNNIITNSLPATVLDEYLPEYSDKSIIDNITQGNLFLYEPPVKISMVSIENSSIKFKYKSKGSFTLYPSYWYFPVWEAQINNETLHLIESKWGTLQLDLPAGEALVEFQKKQPTLRKTGALISSMFLLAFIILTVKTKQRILAL